ncbi:hypothetical protein H480_38040 [Amycolatopsis vancoresmycina DSM 44592]|uniref:Uncharacterized protein n=1 Tax=Amycolatopsis vancoresmycina DSM 44592 TaxID=1292037 RepID=R1HI43_9PSEU|nr:hypothetical protein H480_38040 [Amycolatopsis vancoresmycina DSM 44592]
MSGTVHGNVVQAGRVGDVYLGEVHHHGTTEPDYLAEGVRALGRKDYETAVAQLGQARRATADPELDFLFALALLRGRRPHRVRSNDELTAVRDSLRRVMLLPHARILLLLIEEDRGRGWQQGGTVPDLVPALVAAADPGQVRRILDHVSAPENRVWQLLAAAKRGWETGR